MKEQQKTFEMMREANRKYISECGSLPDIGIIAEAEAFRATWYTQRQSKQLVKAFSQSTLAGRT